MRLVSDVIDRQELLNAAARARSLDQDIYVHEIAQGGARSKRYGITFYAYSLHGKRKTNRNDGEFAASWTAYGYLIAELFAYDPEAKIGQYKNVRDFIIQCEAAREWKSKTDGPHCCDFLDRYL